MLIERYSERNESTIYKYNFPVVEPKGGNGYESTINLKVRVPISENLIYIPATVEVIKFAWVQYVALFIPVIYFMWWFVAFVYGNRIMEATKINPVVRAIPAY